MSADITTLGIRVDSDGVPVATDRLKNLSAEGGRAEQANNRLSQSFAGVAKYVQAAVAAFAAYQLTQMIKDCTLLAARYETLGVVIKVVGNNAGYTGAQMESFAKGLQKQGIAMVESRQTLIMMAQAHIDLAQAQKLGRIAQDAAVIGQTNSSEAFQKMIYGIQSGQIDVLKTIGLNVNFEQSYKKLATQLGKNTTELTENEKMQARVNIVMKAGEGIAGTYEAAMGTAGKQIVSLKRYFDDLKVKFGETFTPALTSGVIALTNGLKAIQENLEGIKTTAAALLGIGLSIYFSKLAVTTLPLLVTALNSARNAYIAFTIATKVAIFGEVAAALPALFTLTFRMQAAAVAAGVLRGALALLGGPIGIITLALGLGITAWVLYADKIKAATAAAREAKQVHDFGKGNVSVTGGKGTFKPAGVEPVDWAATYAKQKEQALVTKQQAALKAQEEADAAANKKTTGADKAARLAEQAARAAEQWRKTYADLQLEIDKLNPALDEHAQKVAEINNKYTDLAGKFPAHVAALESMRLKTLALVEAQRQARQTSAEFKQYEENDKIAESISAALQESDDWNKSIREQITLLDPVIKMSEELAAAIYDIGRAYETGSAAEKAAVEARVNSMMDLPKIEDDNSKLKIDLIEDPYEKQRQTMEDYYAKEKKLIKEKIAALNAAGVTQTAAYSALTDKQLLLEKSQAKDAQKISKEENDAKLQMVGTYAGGAASLFSALASVQDQTSREGFQTAKDFNLAAAIMSTAAGVMNQFSSGDPYTAWFRAALVAATGAIQIAQIESTSFGGGGSVSAPSGSFAAGGGSSVGGSTGLGNLSKPLASIQDSQTVESFARLTASTDNVAVTIGRLSKSIDSLTALFESGGAGFGIANNGPNIGAAIGEVLRPSIFSALTKIGTASALALFNPISAIKSIGSVLFGWGNKYGTTAAGVSLGASGGEVTARDYQDQKKAGGWFTKSKYRTLYQDDAQAAEYMNALIKPYISDIVRMSTTLGTTANIDSYSAAEVKIKTAGQKPEDIAKALEKWMVDTLAGMSKTVDGLQDNIGAYDDAYEMLKKYNDALVSTNDSLELIGKTQLQGSFANAKAVDALQVLMGGTDKFTESVDTYFTSMFTDAQQEALRAAQATRHVADAFAEIGLSSIKTRAQFIAVVNSLDLTTEYGAQTFQALMNISEAFATMTEAATTAAKDMLSTALDVALAAANALQEIMGGTLTTLSPEAMYAQRQAAFNEALANGRTAEMPDLGKALLESSRAYNASGTGYVSDYTAVTKALADIAGMTGSPTLAAADRQVQILTDIKTALDSGNDQSLALAALQINLQGGLNTLIAAYLTASGANSTSTQAAVAEAAQAQAVAADQAVVQAQAAAAESAAQAAAAAAQAAASAAALEAARLARQHSYSIGLTGSSTGFVSATSNPTRGYAIGTPYVPYDMPANIHQGEIIMDRASSDVLRKYGIPSSGAADNRAEINELKAEIIELKNAVVSKLTDIESPLRRVAAR